MRSYSPGYIILMKNGNLKRIRENLLDHLKSCDLCPRNCKVNRMEDERGICKTGRYAMVSSYGPHFGEESCLVGTYGSGTIFFTNCNLLCSFCQNFEISHQGRGNEVSDGDLALIMLELQKRGCHNINLVTPSHVIPQIVSAVAIAAENGLHIPLVYNTGGYDSVRSLRLLNGIIDIYMPDLKFSNPEFAQKACNAPDYFEVAKKAIIEMHHQTGNLKINKKGMAFQGLLVRHLVMPEDIAGAEKIMNFISTFISLDTFINIMDQYYPCGEADKGFVPGRPVTNQEYRKVIEIAKSKGLHRIE